MMKEKLRKYFVEHYCNCSASLDYVSCVLTRYACLRERHDDYGMWYGTRFVASTASPPRRFRKTCQGFVWAPRAVLFWSRLRKGGFFLAAMWEKGLGRNIGDEGRADTGERGYGRSVTSTLFPGFRVRGNKGVTTPLLVWETL
jgi:hypothetical protein